MGIVHQTYSDQQLSSHAATDDRCANFSASTCPTQSLKLVADSTADKLPLEKFHRLLDLVFWVKFLKFDSISCFVFLWDVYRVSLDPVILWGPAALLERGRGGGPRLAAPPGPRLHRPSSIFSTEFSKISRMASKSPKSVFDLLRLARSWLRIVAASAVNFSKSLAAGAEFCFSWESCASIFSRSARSVSSCDRSCATSACELPESFFNRCFLACAASSLSLRVAIVAPASFSRAV